jgi:hypothetical protein
VQNAQLGKDKVMNCTTCNTITDRLDMFPGNVCLECWSQSFGGKFGLVAQELTRMWGKK